MSRVRRDDAKLYFPDRKIHREHADPTKAELAIIQAIAGPIQKLNKLVQIGILQALVSSPEALLAQLQNMARKGSIPIELATGVASIVKSMPPSTKLAALGRLINRLQQENADNWRVVIFTGRRETQTTIQIFLESLGINVGIINGNTGGQNSDTIAKFRSKPPKIQAIVSTEAGAEGVNLQVANVLVNYDLPWNPMIVEQRIGRVQRLASDHAHVSIYNVTLRGTFEEYIVGRLMEKLQMASHAVGDVEALLQSSGISDDDGDSSFEDKILELVLASLAGKDHEKATQLTIKSIDEAKQELEREEANINEMLGSMDGHEYTGPRLPKLPDTPRSMTSKELTLRGLKWLGASLTPYSQDIFVAEEDHSREYIRLSEQSPSNIRTTLYSPGSPAFERLVSRIIASGVHDVDDLDVEPERVSGAIVEKWAKDFGGADVEVTFDEATRSFSGTALLRVRATVAHDSYERLIEISCAAGDHQKTAKGRQLMGLPRLIEDPAIAGIDIDRLVAAANIDEHISEFTRFYLERRAEEMNAAKNDERKRKKLEDEFTPRLEIELVGLKGEVRKEIKLRTSYRISGTQYQSVLKLVPSNRKLTAAPEFGLCSKSGATIPIDCIGECSVTGAAVLKHLLVKSDVSNRYALSEFTVTCSVTGKRALNDEVLLSDLTGNPVIAAELRTSAISGKRAEPVHFVECAFTKATLLRSEVASSEISDKPYRIDQQMRSSVSGKSGHKSEFIFCHETRQPIAPDEAERCEITNHRVRHGVLKTCQATGKKTLPSELERCAATDKLVIRSRLVKSSESQSRCLDTVAIKSLSGRVCLPVEAVTCFWSGKDGHPDDVMECRLTGLNVHSEYATKEGAFRLRPLVEMLDGLRRNQEQIEFWPDVAANLASSNGGKHRIEAAIVSPSKRYLATCSEQKSFLGMRSNSVGAIYDLTDRAVFGQVAVGKRSNGRWVAS